MCADVIALHPGRQSGTSCFIGLDTIAALHDGDPGSSYRDTNHRELQVVMQSLRKCGSNAHLTLKMAQCFFPKLQSLAYDPSSEHDS